MRLIGCMLAVLPLMAPAVSAAAEVPGVAPAPATMSRQGPVDPGSLRDLIGQDVNSQDGEKLGQIKDVVVLDGNRTELVVAVGGFLGVGGKSVTLPYEALSMSDDRLQVNMTEGQLEQQPEYDPDTTPGISLKRGDAPQ